MPCLCGRRELMFDGVHVDSIHADQSQAARQAAVDNFRWDCREGIVTSLSLALYLLYLL